MSPVSSVMSSGTTDQSREDLEPSVAAVDADRDGDEEHIGVIIVCWPLRRAGWADR